MQILFSVLVFAGIALILGILLAVASIVFKTDDDPRITEIAEMLPQNNCGACGYSGCSAYAAAIVNGGAMLTACPSNNKESVQHIAEIMGQNFDADIKQMRAVVMCSGDPKKKKSKYIYEGAKDCSAVARLGGGPLVCSFGCMGYGSCVSVCPSGAISVDSGVAVVNSEKCTGCGLCISSCPKKLIKLVPADNRVFIPCSSKDKGSQTRQYCEIGCIGCKKCLNVCQTQSIHIVDNIAVIDHDTCTSCGDCVAVCPRNIITIKGLGAADGQEAPISDSSDK